MSPCLLPESDGREAQIIFVYQLLNDSLRLLGIHKTSIMATVYCQCLQASPYHPPDNTVRDVITIALLQITLPIYIVHGVYILMKPKQY